MGKRANGEGSVGKQVRKRKNGTEYYIWYAEVPVIKETKIKTENGMRTIPRKPKRFYGKSQQEAIEKRDKWKIAAKAEEFLLPQKLTVKDFLINWKQSKRNLKETTRQIYAAYIEAYIIPTLGNKELQKLTKSDVDAAYNKLLHFGNRKGGPLSSATVRKVHFMLFQALEQAVDDEIILKNPLHKIETPKAVKSKIEPLTTNEIKTLLDYAKNTRLYTALLILLSTGIRRGELLALTWDDADLKAGTLNISKQLVPISTKSNENKESTMKTDLKTENSNRVVGIPKKLITHLQEQKDLLQPAGNSLIICQESGKHYHPRNFQKKFDTVFEKAGIGHKRIHDMRHTFATQLLTSGSYLNEVQISLGHVDPKTTLSVYGHVLPGRQKELAKKINKLLPE